MQTLSIVKIENPSCLWGRVVWGSGDDTKTTDHYNNMLTQMNLFYHDITQDLRKLKPTSLEEGEVCVVYWAAIKSWCRAVVESIYMDSISCQARCRLVDHGERLVISSDQIRLAVPSFLQLPFWVRKFHLAGIKPTTLRVSVFEEKAKLIQSTQWDSSATLYLHNLLQASTQTEAVLLESESDSTSIELYLTVSNIKICVNEELVAKRFAYYSRDSADSEGLDEGDRLPVMLSSSILTQIVSTASNKLITQSQPPPVTSQSPPAAGAVDWLTASSPFESQQHDLVTSKRDYQVKITGQQLSPSSQSSSSSGAAAAPESDPSEDTDSSLAAALAKNLSLFSSVSTSVEVEQGEAEETRRSDEDWTCSRLLEWLNPGPLNTDPDAAVDGVSRSDPSSSGILVHSALPVEPCSSVADAPITDALRSVLRRKQYSTLSTADCYSWPAVARGCNTLIVSHNADQPLSYLPPLLTHILLNSIFASVACSSGPIAVLLCPGWEKVQAVFDLLEESNVARSLHPISVLLGIGKDEAEAFKIPKNCLLLVTTPFSLVRLLSCHSFLFLRLYHLVLDEADQLFTLAPDQMVSILQHFRKVTSSEMTASCPQQLVAIAKRWTSHMEGLLADHMPYPCIVITVPQEAAFYGNIQQITLMTVESSKISILLGALDFNPDVGQKTLIVANSVQEVEDVFKAVSNKSAFCLKIHEGLTHRFDFAIQQWRKDIGPGTQVILVTTNGCVKCLGITDATCVVHCGFPTSPKLFGSRLFCMAENFRNLSEQGQRESCPYVARSVLLISERNARHIVGILRYLRRTNALLPPELLSFAQGIHVAREEQKTDRPLCSYVKSFGVCRESSLCPDRHRFISQLDQSELPASGVIEVVPLYIKTASVFYGRIVKKEDSRFDKMSSEMASYYAEKKPLAKELLEGGLYAVQDDKVFHRVKILSVPDKRDCLFFSVFACFIDVGKEEEVKSYQILHLPEQFHSLPGQAVEIIICRVKPVDAENNWHPKVTRTISQKIRGLQHRGRAVLSLGNTVFVDPMVRVTQVPGVKTLINEYSIQSEILTTGMGISNPMHLDLLRALCQEGPSGSCKEAEHTSRQQDGVPEGAHQSNQQQLIGPGSTDCDDSTISFHPQVRWYQTSDSVTLRVKLMNPENQCCDFYPDRVVYSGRVNGRSYRVDLELHQNIAADCCCLQMNSSEPVLILVKQQQGYWEKLVRNKNMFVSYDMEHIDDDDEDKTPNGLWFVENTGEDNWYLNSESTSDSD
ncbi:putative ATP-dependent RNA helicase TDRD12 [Acanthochromis polyacanthus]|uniref:putative ATP-dependent RNA helicase TDRD12 n=1 Tax=Acanthochromis polyacanthus TaxID=80966 RepID=UPI002234C5C4|nr:putative ATP-dependent RNA helicase TDRD12 [Acanthochromis polyacanthus]